MTFKRIKTNQGTLFMSSIHADALLAAGIRDFYTTLGLFTAQVRERNTVTFMRLKGLLPEGPDVVIAKRYPPSAGGGSIKDMFRHRRAVREFKLSFKFTDAGIPVPEPVAAFEAKKGASPGESYFLTEEIQDARNLLEVARNPGDALAEPAALHGFVDALGKLISHVHSKGMFHGDLNGTNILTVDRGGGNWSFDIIDFGGGKLLRSLSMHQRVKDLARLEKSVGRFTNLTAGARFFKAYAGGDEKLLKSRKEIARLIRERIVKREEGKLKKNIGGSRSQALVERYRRGSTS